MSKQAQYNNDLAPANAQARSANLKKSYANEGAGFNSFLFFSLPELASDKQTLARDSSSLSLDAKNQVLSSQPERDESTHESSSPCEPFEMSSHSESSVERAASLQGDACVEPNVIGDDLLKIIDSCSNYSEEIETSPIAQEEMNRLTPTTPTEPKEEGQFNSIFSSPSPNYLEMASFTSEPRAQQTASTFGQIPVVNQIVINNYPVPHQMYTPYPCQGVAPYGSMGFEMKQPLPFQGYPQQHYQAAQRVSSVIQIPNHQQPTYQVPQYFQQQYLTSSNECIRAPRAENKNISEKVAKKKPAQRSAEHFDFPDGGWECSKCQNYNFKGRKECHRCKKHKSDNDQDGKPEHMLKPFKKAKQQPVAKKARPSKGVKKPSHERQGDWVCGQCQNHNFAFRNTCNLCQGKQALE